MVRSKLPPALRSLSKAELSDLDFYFRVNHAGLTEKQRKRWRVIGESLTGREKALPAFFRNDLGLREPLLNVAVVLGEVSADRAHALDNWHDRGVDSPEERESYELLLVAANAALDGELWRSRTEAARDTPDLAASRAASRAAKVRADLTVLFGAEEAQRRIEQELVRLVVVADSKAGEERERARDIARYWREAFQEERRLRGNVQKPRRTSGPARNQFVELSVAQVAARLGVDDSTIRRLIEGGELKRSRHGYIRLNVDDIQAFRRRANRAAPPLTSESIEALIRAGSPRAPRSVPAEQWEQALPQRYRRLVMALRNESSAVRPGIEGVTFTELRELTELDTADLRRLLAKYGRPLARAEFLDRNWLVGADGQAFLAAAFGAAKEFSK